MINTPPGDAAEDEVGAAGSGSAGTPGEVGGGGRERAQRSREGREEDTLAARGEKGKARASRATTGTGNPTSPSLPALFTRSPLPGIAGTSADSIWTHVLSQGFHRESPNAKWAYSQLGWILGPHKGSTARAGRVGPRGGGRGRGCCEEDNKKRGGMLLGSDRNFCQAEGSLLGDAAEPLTTKWACSSAVARSSESTWGGGPGRRTGSRGPGATALVTFNNLTPKRKRILNGVLILYAELRRDTFQTTIGFSKRSTPLYHQMTGMHTSITARSLPSAPPPLLSHSNMALGQQPGKALHSSNHKEAQIRAELDGSQDPGPHSPGS
ncbi:hypothetical protein EYF80_026387 [Liparis tanakae]|uniref:Uncharacterized protein n=1 Tax=Liparis tanakae TaxID=230148 RepID=A0A4Z2HDM6_9TELE|nr:hypothetical protein EYF80_026387 [Liparis tanakae]